MDMIVTKLGFFSSDGLTSNMVSDSNSSRVKWCLQAALACLSPFSKVVG